MTSREATGIAAGSRRDLWEPEGEIPSGYPTTTACQFSNWMPSSQIQCHLDAIYDTKMRIKDLSTSFGSAAAPPGTRGRGAPIRLAGE